MQCPETGRFSTMRLVDDGTLDTVFRCSGCDNESRYTFDGNGTYEEFRNWAREDASIWHQDYV